MSRYLRVEYPGAIYHVTVRMLGDWKKSRDRLFEDDADRERLLERMADRVERYRIRLYLFCLMTNHVHLVLETPEGNLGRFMQSLTTAYTVYFNLRHGRHGHLLDGRYKAKLVEGDEYLLGLSRYVHLNPVRVGGIEKKPIEEQREYLRGYRWSTYPSYIGKRAPYDFVEYGPMLVEVGGKGKERRRRYQEYVETGIGEEDEELKEALRASACGIGGESFLAWVSEQYGEMVEKQKRPEDIAFRHVIEGQKPEELLKVLGDVLGIGVEEFKKRRRNSWVRMLVSYYLAWYAGLTQREVAEFLRVGTGSAVGKQMKRLVGERGNDHKLAKIMKQIEAKLNNAGSTKMSVVKA